MPGIDLLEGNPPSEFHWTFESAKPFKHRELTRSEIQPTIAIGSQLILDKFTAQKVSASYGKNHPSDESLADDKFYASRVLSGNYTCVATNSHGSSSSTLTINVFCKCC
ncbi:hypothetical protein QR98_0046760 [Sarcoptes scabiei]|uniref:Ig-like domain-containing protein n=1 Tax=Sarcoptes scabiei TaxID=52283 RepID=A0A132A5F6_SARSC|nr:hypothetical protein QR98_0046760 [Sarcoptes scabiei]